VQSSVEGKFMRGKTAFRIAVTRRIGHGLIRRRMQGCRNSRRMGYVVLENLFTHTRA
jgi:hypothetical protein